MVDRDIRWIQRFSNFKKALEQLSVFVEQERLNKMEIQGLIQCFEYNYELAWNTIKDFYESQGETNIQGSRDAIRLALKRGLIDAGDPWMRMIKSRTLTAHTYNEDIANKVADAIRNEYYGLFSDLRNRLMDREKTATG